MANSQDKIFSTAPSNLQVQFNASSTASEAAESTSQGTLYATPHGLYLNKQLIAQDTFSAFQTKGKTAEYSSVNVSVAAATNQDTLTLEFGNGLVVGADDTNDHITVNLKNAGVPLISTVIDSNNYLNGSLDVHPVTDQYYLVYVDAAKKVSGAGYSMKLTYAGGTQTCTLAVTQNNGTTTGSLVSITPGIHIVRFTNFTATESGTFSGTVDFLDSWQVVKAATAETAEKLSTSAGSATQPVYFNGGKPVATTYTLNATVPAGAKFTDTTYSAATTSAAGLMSSADKAKLDGIAANANNYSLPAATEDTLGGVMIGTGLSMQTGHIMNAGVRSISTGNTDGTISVNTNGDSAEVAVKGLAAAAYKGVDTAVTANSTNLITSGAVNSALGSYIMGNAKGAKGGIASLDEDGKVPSSQLPSYVDDVLEFAKLTSFPGTGETGKIYVALDTNKCYRWSGSTYIEISATEVPAATASILGGIKTGYTTNDKNYKVQVDASNNAYVNVPWTDTNTDTKVTAVSNHYTPVANDNAALSADASGGGVTDITGATKVKSVVTGVDVKRDAAGHVTAISVDSAALYSTDTVPAAYCSTVAATAAKTALFTGYALRTNNIFPITFASANAAQGALTLNVNDTGAKNLFINGVASSASNYTIPAGTYICHYDGTQYQIRNDERLPSSITIYKADTATNANSANTAAYATRLETIRTINGTPFNGTANIITNQWGTARNISIADSSVSNTGAAVSVNGSANVTLKLPGTIKATLDGNAATATKATSADSAATAASAGYATSAGSASTASKLGSLTETIVKATLYWQ